MSFPRYGLNATRNSALFVSVPTDKVSPRSKVALKEKESEAYNLQTV